MDPRIIVLLSAVAFAGVAAAEKPWFCHDLDCPKYKVVNTTEAYEVREYEASKWASTVISGYVYSASLDQGFMRLFKYISGDNDDKVKIEMTAPVVTTVVPGDGPFCKSNFTVSFFVPPDNQGSTPRPSNPDVFIEKAPACVVYVSQFGGYLVDDFTLSSKAAALREAVVADGLEVVEGAFYTAGYDPPFRLQHRHNEIWIEAKSSRVGRDQALSATVA